MNGTFYVASNFMLRHGPERNKRFDDLVASEPLYREGDEIGSTGRDHQCTLDGDRRP